MAGITIKDAPLVERLELNDKFPVSNGSGLPISANLQQVKTLVNDGNATKEDLESKQDKIEDLESIRQGALKGTTAIQLIPSEYITESKLNNKGYATKQELTNKVDKVIGKQLSTEDFTTLLKLKLEGLSNYDDTEINKVVSKLRTDLDILVNGDTTTAIKTFNEVIAFLDGLEDTESLKSIIASIEMLIASKQDNISDLKEIREGSNKGKTSVQPEELSNVAKSGSYDDLNNKPYIPAEITESTIEQWGFTKNEGTYTKPNDGIPRSDLSENVLSSLNKADTALQEHQDISGKVDKVEGKQLSTEDFTTTLKERLLTLSNYDDTELNKALEKLREDLDSLVDGDSTTAIESFNEIIAFLEGIEDSQSLDNIIASIEQQIAAVARVIPTKVSLLDNDEGYLTEHQDVSGKLDKIEAISTYLTKADAQTTYLGINGKAKSAEIADKATQATKATQDAAGRNLTVTYATKAELNNKQDKISDLETIRSGAALGATALQSVPSSYNPTLDVLKLVYPVGAIYMSMVETNPSVLFGFGTWEQVKGRFLLGAANSLKAGDIGGEATVTLTKAQTPAHTHTRGTMEIYGALTERPCNSSVEILNSKPNGAFVSTMQGDTTQWGVTVVTQGQSNHKNNLHEFIASKNWTGETSSVGSGEPHNNLPPYLVVYIWKRTA